MRGVLGLSSIISNWQIEMTLKFYTSVEKGSKLKVRKIWRLIPTFVRVTGGKLVGVERIFLFLPILNIVIQNGVGAKRPSPLSYPFWVKKDDDDETVDVDHSYIGDEYKGLINIFMSRLRDVNFHLTKFDSGKRGLTNILSIYLEKKRYWCAWQIV